MPVGSTAVVYCEAQFGEQDGKTANGLVRHSEKYDVLSVIDSTRAGVDSGQFLDSVPNGIPVLASLRESIAHAGHVPDYLICGVAPADGLLSDTQRVVLLDGIARGMHIINGLHEFLNDDAEFVAAALIAGVTITDVRRPKDTRDLHLFTGRIFDVTCPRIAILGTDGAIGKRTTATILVQALNDQGIRAVMVGTGQTTLIQGGKYGAALDAMVPQFISGEVEHQMVLAFENEDPDVIVVEGQGALSHPAYLSSGHILRGSRPDGVIVQHAPKRKVLGDFPMMPMPTAASEIKLIEAFADTRVIGVTINHEEMTAEELTDAIAEHHRHLGLPVTDPLTRPGSELVEMVLKAYPALRERVGATAAASV
ncbi:EBNA-1 nuclear protein [Nocardioides sp. Root614]|nr:EBNA-1 nuclear protein [Nocardioides sp. Root614]KRA93418.1 EBNA-1 nuclear protein [Nocardioides sp. Root682]